MRIFLIVDGDELLYAIGQLLKPLLRNVIISTVLSFGRRLYIQSHVKTRLNNIVIVDMRLFRIILEIVSNSLIVYYLLIWLI